MSMTGGSVETNFQEGEIVWADWMMRGAIALFAMAMITAVGTGVCYLASVMR